MFSLTELGWNSFHELRTFACSGGKGRDYNGHLFWDTEMYILPAMVLTHPDMVKYILRYRSAFAQQAMELAQSMEHEGEFATIVDVQLERKNWPFQLNKSYSETRANQVIFMTLEKIHKQLETS